MGASLKLLKIQGYTDKNFTEELEGKPYKVMINPESIKWYKSIDYSHQEPAADSPGPCEEYKYTPSDNLSFDIVIDCTGVVDPNRTNMETEIKALERIIYTYNGEIHRPNYVEIRWGKIVFRSVLKSFNTTYTLFKPNGDPLRARISLTFGEYMSPKEREKRKAKKSADITQVVEVVDGDTLPQLCKKIWNDESHYIQLARYNNLNKFRNLKGGMKLLFPPIINPN